MIARSPASATARCVVSEGERQDRRRDDRSERRVGPEHQDARRAQQRVHEERHDRGVEARLGGKPGDLRVAHAGGDEQCGDDESRTQVGQEPGAPVVHRRLDARRHPTPHPLRRHLGPLGVHHRADVRSDGGCVRPIFVPRRHRLRPPAGAHFGRPIPRTGGIGRRGGGVSIESESSSPTRGCEHSPPGVTRRSPLRKGRPDGLPGRHRQSRHHAARGNETKPLHGRVRRAGKPPRRGAGRPVRAAAVRPLRGDLGRRASPCDHRAGHPRDSPGRAPGGPPATPQARELGDVGHRARRQPHPQRPRRRRTCWTPTSPTTSATSTS